MDALPYIVLIACLVLLLRIGINRLLDRLGIRPVETDAARGGLAEVADALERWAAKRRGR